MKLAVSNIAWNQHDDPLILNKLKDLGISGIEIAPTKIWPNWENISQKSAEEYKNKLNDLGFKIPSLQAILFGKPELNLFNTSCHQQYLDHLRLVTDIANGLDANVLVFGAPKNRKRDQVSFSEAEDIAQEFFSKVGDICLQQNCKIGIEHNPVEYGCDFLTNVKDVSEFVQKLNHPAIQLHIDSAGIHMCGGNISSIIEQSISFIHYHISEPMLEPISNGVVDHLAAAEALKARNYNHWLSIEMKQPDNTDLLYASVSKSITDYTVQI